VAARDEVALVTGERELTCVVADDHPAILDCVTRYLEAAGMSVPAAVPDGAEAFAAVLQLRPDVCIADVAMPQLDGIALARELADAAPETAVLVYSGSADAALATEALGAGARGYALKDGPLSDLERAIRTVAAGGVYVDPVLAAVLAAPSRDTPKPLSGRELDVLRLLAEGGSYVEIGTALSVSPDTVRSHMQRAMTKLGARTRTQAVALAYRHSLLG
jgi:DNA-binding NarL/FixJ family response regulator